jgi:CRISPR system Cascade subunit CasE
MFLTRFEINTARRAAWPLVASPQRLHAAVLAAFPESRREPVEGRILWRLDRLRHDAALYIVSPDQPDLTHLAEQVGRPTYGWQTGDYGEFLKRLAAGDRWAFRLQANPIHNARPVGDATRGKRYAHVTVAQQSEWFLRRAQRLGFTVVDSSSGEPDLIVRDRRTQRFQRQSRTVTVASVVFEGTLRIDAPETLRAALIEGIGSAKGYGCGLMTLASVRT